MTAAAHGLSEDAERLAEGLEERPALEADAALLLPPTPILKEDNWPLLTVSKGFFENLATGGPMAASLCCKLLFVRAKFMEAVQTHGKGVRMVE